MTRLQLLCPVICYLATCWCGKGHFSNPCPSGLRLNCQISHMNSSLFVTGANFLLVKRDRSNLQS